MRFLVGSGIFMLAILTCLAPEPVRGQAEARWVSVLGEVEPGRDGVAGKWKKSDGGLLVDAAPGARLVLPVTAQGEYDVKVTFTRRQGQHSIALIFPHGGGQAAFEVDAWGEHLGGLQNVAGKSIRENSTRKNNLTLKNGQRYTMTVEVRKDQVRALLDDQVVTTHRTNGGDLSLSNAWPLASKTALAIGAWDSETLFHAVEVRSLSGMPLVKAGSTDTPKTPMVTPMPMPTTKAGGKRVVIVLANHHFFYREYGDPRQELERAGIKVSVAAAVKGVCRPHPNSGQGPDGGMVQADLALAEVRVEDFDAVLFAGGWGASCYQFAFTGRYNEAAYNGDPALKQTANKVVNDFLGKDRYVCGLCNGVSVLAWARVGDQSPLRGKRVCAPRLQAPPGVYEGRQAQPASRWHSEVNGAQVSPPGAVGRPGTAEDDVQVDGRIITGEDDTSARELGRRLAQALLGR